MGSLLIAGSANAQEPSLLRMMEAGHWKRARIIVRRRAEEDPKSAETAYLLSRVELAFSLTDDALRDAERAVALDPKRAEYHFQLARVYGELARTAHFLRQLGLVKHFKREAETARALDPSHLDARLGLMEFFVQAPQLLGGHKARALAMAAEVARIDPVAGQLAAARLAQDEKDPAREEAAYRSAAELDPRRYEAQIDLANFYYARKDYDASERHARKAIEIDPHDVRAWGRVAEICVVEHRLGELEELLSDAEAAVPDDLLAYHRAAEALLKAGQDLPLSERFFRKYLTREPEAAAPGLAETHLELGLLLEKEARKGEAIQELEIAVELKPALSAARKALGRLE